MTTTMAATVDRLAGWLAASHALAHLVDRGLPR